MMPAKCSIEEKLRRRVTVSGPDECWPWTGASSRQGYGNLGHGGKTLLAHRVAFRLAFGVDPSGGVVMHKCDNPPCCNPRHLVLGTVGENNKDRHQKNEAEDLRCMDEITPILARYVAALAQPAPASNPPEKWCACLKRMVANCSCGLIAAPSPELSAEVGKMVPASPSPSLDDTAVVHINMLRGTIAKLSPEQIGHLYRGEQAKAVVAEVMRQSPEEFAASPSPGLREQIAENANRSGLREAVIEECAKVAETFSCGSCGEHDLLAAAIRALASRPVSEREDGQ